MSKYEDYKHDLLGTEPLSFFLSPLEFMCMTGQICHSLLSDINGDVSGMYSHIALCDIIDCDV